MRIYQNEDGSVYVNAIDHRDGMNVNGHEYTLHNGYGSGALRFQSGPVRHSGHNGLQTEQVLSVLIHRLGVLNKTVPCRENAIAITHLETALLWLEKRTADREKRGVEGTTTL